MTSLIDLASAVVAHETRLLETASQNIANISTPGYKRQLSFSSLVQPKNGSPAITGLAATSEATDFTAGKLITSSNPTDLALTGEGFFELMTPTGPAYTRHGGFHLDDAGKLVSPQGWPVQAAEGGNFVIQGNDWSIAQDGTLTEGGRAVSKLKIVDFSDKTALQRGAGGVFVTTATPVDVDVPSVRQGFLESSNVSTAQDMVQIMEALRRAEAGQKLVHAYDDMLGRALQQDGGSAS